MKMIARIVSYQRRQVARAAAAKPRPSNQRRRRQPKQRIGVKNIEGKVHSRTFKINRLMAQPKNINVKKNDVIVRKRLYEGEQYSQQKLEGFIIKITYVFI